MGISLSLLPASDEEIRSFLTDPAQVDRRFVGVASSGSAECCHLNDRWAAIHVLLSGDPDASGPPLGWLNRGEVAFAGASDPSFGVYSATVRDFAAALREISDAELRARYDATDFHAAGPRRRSVYPGRWGPPGDRFDVFPELLSCFRGLKRLVERAAEAGDGVVFCRYEDW